MFGYLAALGSSIAYGAALVLAKKISGEVSPIVACAFSLTFGLAIVGWFGFRDLFETRRAPKIAYVWASLSGIVATMGILLVFLAMQRAPAIVVAPIIGLNPLVAIFLGQIFLRKLEPLTWRVAGGATLIVTGITIITISRNI